MSKANAVTNTPIRNANKLLVAGRFFGWMAMSLWFLSLALDPSSINNVSASILFVSAILLIANEMTVISDAIEAIKTDRELSDISSMGIPPEQRKERNTEGKHV